MPVDDLGVLPADLQTRARAEENGEVSWHVDDAASVLGELANAGRVVLGLDVREYDEDGSFLEVAWSVYAGVDPIEARDAALGALSRGGLPGDWILVTW
ncbi:hypothetical protein [Cellulomonas sp. URHE0023]|uniref:hypothetical protein n=1 Tax=Cellulomonas sp. URHE0023 TaxID=1380354 RepID=UPI0012DE3F74|nr:hypothetical protein [Cellulomonas sp. URHE0023]